jgi:site-specific recombinase XerD
VYKTVLKRASQVGIEHFSPHSLRRSFVSTLLNSGVDLATVSKMAGHANIQTTAMYDVRPGEVQRAGAEVLHIPYKKS